MKKLMLIIAIAVAGSLFAGVGNNNSSVPVIGIENNDQVSGIGTILLKGDIWVISVSNGAEAVEYCPVNLPQNLQKSGLIVKFSGNTKEIAPNERWAAIPIVLSQIKAVR
jgi:uncharacterized lipoprotein YmbA